MTTWFWVWIVVAAFFSVAEIFTAGFVLLPFGIGAVFAAIANAFGLSLPLQWGVFLVIAVVTLFALRPFARRITKDSPIKTGAERLVGQTGIVLEEIHPNMGSGMVRVERESWRADVYGDETLPVNTKVLVLEVKGTHLLVEKFDEVDTAL